MEKIPQEVCGGAGEVAHPLKASAAFPKGLGLVPSTHDYP